MIPDTLSPARDALVSTGSAGLDDILGGGLQPERVYLLEGAPGTGKTTLAMQFLLQGAAAGEAGLYITLSESETELRHGAASHGWSLDGLDIFELVADSGLDPDSEQSVLHPSEFELGEAVRGVMERVEAGRPRRIVLDSLSEMRLLAQSPLRYRRQVLALKRFFSRRRCTVLLLDDRTSTGGDHLLHSIAHGVITLEQAAIDFGSERRRLHVVKMRGQTFKGGHHDFAIETGGLEIYPRLVAADHHRAFSARPVTTGVPDLDAMLGGGLVPGTNTLLIGPSGVGKSTTACACVFAALQRGEHAAYFLFAEGLPTLLARMAGVGMDLRPYLDSGRLTVRQIDPAELSPGAFASAIRHSVESGGASMIVIDSLNAYLQSMPGERHLLLQMHELLSYLNQQGAVTLMLLGQHGTTGAMRTDLDLSYLSDAILLLRYFEAGDEMRKAISVLKTRTTDHLRTIREFVISSAGLSVGEPLRQFRGEVTGLPEHDGAGQTRLVSGGEPDLAPRTGPR